MAKCIECGKGFVPPEALLAVCSECAKRHRQPTLAEVQEYYRWAVHMGLEPL